MPTTSKRAKGSVKQAVWVGDIPALRQLIKQVEELAGYVRDKLTAADREDEPARRKKFLTDYDFMTDDGAREAKWQDLVAERKREIDAATEVVLSVEQGRWSLNLSGDPEEVLADIDDVSDVNRVRITLAAPTRGVRHNPGSRQEERRRLVRSARITLHRPRRSQARRAVPETTPLVLVVPCELGHLVVRGSGRHRKLLRFDVPPRCRGRTLGGCSRSVAVQRGGVVGQLLLSMEDRGAVRVGPRRGHRARSKKSPPRSDCRAVAPRDDRNTATAKPHSQGLTARLPVRTGILAASCAVCVTHLWRNRTVGLARSAHAPHH